MTGQGDAAAAEADREQADRQARAREQLLRLELRRRDDPSPAHPRAPASAVDLVQLALSRSSELAPQDILSALALLPAARSEVEALEDALLFVARSEGLTWAQIARAMEFKSPQACQQHYTRLSARRAADA